MLAKLDQLTTGAEELMSGPGDAEIYAWAEDLREHLVKMRAKVDEKIDLAAN